ncbi:MAG: hypothetical protein MI976_24515 [Pseudomonadales bacterium]|nr:hypothetical protein [Pseudomonadales bacterium]
MEKTIEAPLSQRSILPGGSFLAVTTLILVLLITAAIHLLVSEPVLGTWGALWLISCVPSQVCVGMLMQKGYPKIVADMNQPFKGFCYVLLSLVLGAIFTLLSFYTVGGGVELPRPPLIQYSIVTVVITFWFVIIWNFWPLRVENTHPLVVAITLYSVCYLFGYLVFNGLFNFDFLQGSPIYVDSIDPKGLFNGWYVVAFLVTSVAMIFTLVLLEFWPVYRWATEDQQLRANLIATSLLLVATGTVFYACLFIFDLDPVQYLVYGPVTYIFGVFVPLNLYRGSLLKHLQQPLRGGVLVLVSVASGILLNFLYLAFANNVLPAMEQGAPTYALELWLANAMLAFSFPVLVAITDHLEFWPIQRH